MIKVCEFCGKEFVVEKYPHRKMCSKECEKERILAFKRKRYAEQYVRNKNRSGKKCKICGELLENGCQTYCLECCLKGSQDKGKKTYFMHILACRGYDAEMVKWEIEQRKGV